MARRKPAARSTKPRTRRSSGPPALSRTGPIDVGARSTSEPTGGPDAAEPQALVANQWFDSGIEGEPWAATIRFTGRRVEARGTPRARDTFAQDETIDGIVPGTGPVSITTWVYGLQAGKWLVTGELIGVSGGAGDAATRGRSKFAGFGAVHPAVWSWRRWAVSTGTADPVKTRWALLAPLARQPAVVPGIYTALAVVGILLAVIVQTMILAPWGVSMRGSLITSAAAIGSGLIGAKVLYAALHPEESIIRGGWAVDGFLLVFPVVAAVTLRFLELPIGLVLDASTPGVFFAVAIGRIGCFLTGCCAGQCTRSRWGIWSSDRRVGARRVPTQLLESGAGLTIALVTLVIVLGGKPAVGGVIFVAAFVVYAVIRQLLLRLRAERRKSARSLPLTAVAAAASAVLVAALSLTQGT